MSVEKCEVCEEEIEGYDTYHIHDVVGHLDCFSEAINEYVNRRKVCIDCLTEQIDHFDVKQFIEIVPEHECEFYTDR